MTAKEFLSQAYLIDQRINSKLEQIRSLHALVEKATSVLSPTPRNATRNVHRMEDVIVKILDLEAEINCSIDELVNTKRTIMSTLQRIPATEQRTLLELRYICEKTWEEICAELQYSARNTHRIHGAALHELGKMLAV